MTDIRLMRLQVHQVCCSHGVSVAWLFSYGNFGQQMKKGKRLYHGSALERYAWELIERYVGLGLERKVLEDIRSSVFQRRPVAGGNAARYARATSPGIISYGL